MKSNITTFLHNLLETHNKSTTHQKQNTVWNVGTL